MDANQYATGEGPCVDASVEGRWFHAASLDDEARWPMFTPRAKALGINAILSSPLLAEDRPVGALNIYSRNAATFTPKDQELAAVFATEASVILTSAGVDASDDKLATRLAEALRTRQIIAQAEGVIMERECVSEERAYSALREFSQKSGQRLRERAQDVVASTQWPPGDLGLGAGLP
jgi:transcriptional regulator with GAF, ATPase, and Fis domain